MDGAPGAMSEGRNIGPWVLKRMLGRGGFGSVWLAEHREWPGRLEAFKFPEGERALARLKKEAGVLRTLEHPNVVKVLDVDTLCGTPYLRMEYVEGGSLEDMLRERGMLPHAEAVRLANDVLEGLGYAHEKGVVHRDLKPANILIGKDGRARISDFGLAAMPSEEPGAAGSLDSASSTRDGRGAAGTPDYMAPEQKEGADPNPKSDIYSLGVVFYRMLAGTLPSSINPPSHFAPDVPEVLDLVVSRMLDPVEERYSTAREVMDDLACEVSEAGDAVAALSRPWKGSALGEIAFAVSVSGLVAVVSNLRALGAVPAGALISLLALLAVFTCRLSASPAIAGLFWAGVTAVATGSRLHWVLHWAGIGAIAAAVIAWIIRRAVRHGSGREEGPAPGQSSQ